MPRTGKENEFGGGDLIEVTVTVKDKAAQVKETAGHRPEYQTQEEHPSLGRRPKTRHSLLILGDYLIFMVEFFFPL